MGLYLVTLRGPDGESTWIEDLLPLQNDLDLDPLETAVPLTVDNATLDLLCDYLDAEAEGANLHRLVGLAAHLGAYVEEVADVGAALLVLLMIAEDGGWPALAE